ncbi:divalent cation tolerance protein [Hasllibacter halocynthiae]|uniref:Divalent cation tolerance protein n=1 Tax=Hasllibacter halocynthiae TaxID=595589 RepID=A0A2T0X2Z6_9RHOB|nr:divalent-cation tolerance protein CutA [Hasllibacter halocynthiae]PRY93323.1 divalent cation tolerance protein [Hasllibacter halocynthiae]
MSALLVQTTLPSEGEAGAIARAAVEARLAACAHVDRIASVFRWDGAVREAEEWRVWLKTTAAAREALFALVARLHPYDEPALIALPIVHGAPSFLDWIASETGGPPPAP